MTKKSVPSLLGLIFILLACGACSSPRPDLEWMTSVAYSPDGKFLAAGTNYDNKVRVWEAGTGKLIYTLSGHSGHVYGVAFSPDGSLLASGSDDQTAIFWDLATGKKTHVFHPAAVNDGTHVNFSQVNAVAFSPEGKWFVTASKSNSVQVWDTTRTELVRTLAVPDSPQGVQFSPEGKFLAVFTWGATSGPYLWDTTNFEMTQLGRAGEDAVEAFAFSPDSQTMAVSKEDFDEKGDRLGLLEVWNLAGNRRIKSWPATEYHTASRALAYSPDGKLLAYSDNLELFTLWEAQTGAAVPVTIELPAKPNSPYSDAAATVWGFAFSPDGTQIAVAANFKTLAVWEVASGKLLWQF